MTEPGFYNKYTLSEPGYYWEKCNDRIELGMYIKSGYFCYIGRGDDLRVSDGGDHIEWYGPLSIRCPWEEGEDVAIASWEVLIW